MSQLKTGPWKLSDLDSVEKNGCKVLSTFSCGGGSTMGYKLAGFDVIGCVEIDPEMMAVYKKNHNPKYSYLMGVQDFKKIPNEELPKEFFELDILDGSPPCSSFSMAGSREKKWGKASHFREGQAVQHLDDLFFEFIEVAAKLKPKVVIAENVKGLIQGNAKGYVKQIFTKFKEAGYDCQLFLLNASRMGVPQARERTVFVANLSAKKINLKFNEKVISAFYATDGKLDGYMSSGANVRHCANGRRPKWASKNREAPTVMATNGIFIERKPGQWDQCSSFEASRLSTFPDDFNCKNLTYICGMSVPPFMMQRVADQVYKQLLKTSN
jgi:DNA (cytosine-5)-methyltransferase 1